MSAYRLIDAMQGPGAGAGHDQGQGLGPLLQVALPQMRVHLHTALQDTLLLYCVMCVLSGYLHKTHAGHVTPESAEALRGAGGTRTGRLRPSSPTDSVSYFHPGHQLQPPLPGCYARYRSDTTFRGRAVVETVEVRWH